MDGNGALFGTLQGNTREVLHKFTVDLPKKHGMNYSEKMKGYEIVFVVDFLKTMRDIYISNTENYKKYRFQVEVVNLHCVLLDYEWKNDTIMFGKWLKSLPNYT